MNSLLALICFLAFALNFSPAYSNHKIGHATPPGLQDKQAVCDCLAVEIRQSVFENSARLAGDQQTRELIAILTVFGSMECTEPDPDFATVGEALFRAAMLELTGIEAVDQEFCRGARG